MRIYEIRPTMFVAYLVWIGKVLGALSCEKEREEE